MSVLSPSSDKGLQSLFIIGPFDLGLGLVSLGREIIADLNRIGAPPVIEIGIGIGGAAAHGGHVNCLLEAVGLDRDGGRNVAPIGNDEVGHGMALMPMFADRR
jgi:hypothetical protein